MRALLIVVALIATGLVQVMHWSDSASADTELAIAAVAVCVVVIALAYADEAYVTLLASLVTIVCLLTFLQGGFADLGSAAAMLSSAAMLIASLGPDALGAVLDGALDSVDP